MSINQLLIASTAAVSIFLGTASNADDSMNKYGIEKQTTDTYNTRTETYRKELGKTQSGNGYGFYGSSTREFNNYGGERDTSANEVQGGGSKGSGFFMQY